MVKRMFGLAIKGVIGLGLLALVMPTPSTNACKFCRPIQCPPCYQLTVGSCNKCPTCERIPGCNP